MFTALVVFNQHFLNPKIISIQIGGVQGFAPSRQQCNSNLAVVRKQQKNGLSTDYAFDQFTFKGSHEQFRGPEQLQLLLNVR